MKVLCATGSPGTAVALDEGSLTEELARRRRGDHDMHRDGDGDGRAVSKRRNGDCHVESWHVHRLGREPLSWRRTNVRQYGTEGTVVPSDRQRQLPPHRSGRERRTGSPKPRRRETGRGRSWTSRQAIQPLVCRAVGRIEAGGVTRVSGDPFLAGRPTGRYDSRGGSAAFRHSAASRAHGDFVTTGLETRRAAFDAQVKLVTSLDEEQQAFAIGCDG